MPVGPSIRPEPIKSRSTTQEPVIDIPASSSKYAHSTITMALEVDRLADKVQELTTQNEELESTITYHLKAMEETHNESKALHAVLKLIKANTESQVSELLPLLTEALASSGCNDLAAIINRKELKTEKPLKRRANAEQLDVLVNLILNGHQP